MNAQAVGTGSRRPPSTPQGEVAAADSSWLICRIGRHLCAVPIAHVVEIMRHMPIEVVAGAPAYVQGLCIIRGTPVPVVDLGLIVGGETTRPDRLVTLRADGRTIALAAEAVLGIRAIAPDTFGELPPLLRGVAPETVAAIGMLDAELIYLLRAARIVPSEVLDHLVADEARP
jgi:purine-binding chemotaxis protein CheW